MESTEPKMISPGFRLGAIALTAVAVGAMALMTLRPDWLALALDKGEPLNISFRVPGELDPRSLSQFRGRVIVVTLWRAKDCPDCQQELGVMHELAVRYGREGLLAVALTAEDSTIIRNYPTLKSMAVMAGSMDNIQADVLPRERPYCYIIDREGRVRKKVKGYQDASTFVSMVEKLIAR